MTKSHFYLFHREKLGACTHCVSPTRWSAPYNQPISQHCPSTKYWKLLLVLTSPFLLEKVKWSISQNLWTPTQYSYTEATWQMCFSVMEKTISNRFPWQSFYSNSSSGGQSSPWSGPGPGWKMLHSELHMPRSTIFSNSPLHSKAASCKYSWLSVCMFTNTKNSRGYNT